MAGVFEDRSVPDVNNNFSDAVSNSVDRISRSAERTNDSLKSAFDAAKGVAVKAGGVIKDFAQNPASNPWMQGLAAMGAAILTWKAAPWLLEKLVPGDGALSRLTRGVGGLALVGMVAYSAAVGVGALRDDPEAEQSDQPLASAAEDESLNAPAQPIEQKSFSLAPGGP